MSIWLALSLILGVTAIYLFMIEVFFVAFKLTGLATNKIKFQVASLFTGAGFTTGESEIITNDDRRRKIAVLCMYTGHIFSVVIMGLVINVLISIWAEVNAAQSTLPEWYFVVFFITLGLFLIMVILKIPPVNKRFQKILENAALKISKKRRESNIVTVIDYYGRSAVVEVILNNIPEFAKDITLGDMALTKKYAFILLSIKRGNRRISVSKDSMFAKGDIIVAYGLINDIREAFVNSVAGKKNGTIVVDNTNEFQILNNYGPNTLMEIAVNEVPKEIEGKALKDSHLVELYSLRIVIIKRNNEYLFVDKDMMIEKGDLLTVFGPYMNIKHLFNNSDK